MPLLLLHPYVIFVIGLNFVVEVIVVILLTVIYSSFYISFIGCYIVLSSALLYFTI